MAVDLVIMALGNDSNPIIKDSEPRIKTSKWGTILVENGAETTLKDVYSGGDATRGGSTAINAAGDGKAAAEQIVGEIPFTAAEIKDQVARAAAYTAQAQTALHDRQAHRSRRPASSRSSVKAPMVAKSAQAGQFVRVLAEPKGELIPLTLADWDAKAGTIDLVIQAHGHQHHRDQPDEGRRSLHRHRRSARPAVASCTATRATRRWCSSPAASACRRSTRSCASICGWATTSR